MTLEYGDLVKEARSSGKIPPRYELVCTVNKFLSELTPYIGLVPNSILISDKGGLVIFGDEFGDYRDKIYDFRIEFFNRGDYLSSITDARGEVKETIGRWK